MLRLNRLRAFLFYYSVCGSRRPMRLVGDRAGRRALAGHHPRKHPHALCCPDG